MVPVSRSTDVTLVPPLFSCGVDANSEKYSAHVRTDLDEVAALLERDVPVEDRARFQAELDVAAPYVKERTRPLIARIQLAMLYMAKGDFDRLVAARELADVDWRDLLMQAEYPSTPSVAQKKMETPGEHNERIAADVEAINSWRRRT